MFLGNHVHSACIGCCCSNCFLCLFFWLVLILSPRLRAIPWDLARMRMWPGREMKKNMAFPKKKIKHTAKDTTIRKIGSVKKKLTGFQKRHLHLISSNTGAKK